ncbi:MAG TPA: hypothetical protein VIA06_22170 [Candidatus Dormibacteraeota bacterium]|nr:hypothetical protein [Candidatus Dormibacteraeota bacterium]
MLVVAAILILVELIAVIRVLGAMAGVALRPTSILLGVVMVGACALTLINPLGAYDLLLRPSLIAL